MAQEGISYHQYKGEEEIQEVFKLIDDELSENASFMLDENSLFSSNYSGNSENRKEMEVKMGLYAPKEIVREEVKYIEKPSRKITEIRIFFDNGTYETFHPDK